MTGITIQSGVPIPPPQRTRRRKYRYPFQDMQPGDSIFVPGARAAHLHQTARRNTAGTGWRFTTRAVAENGVAGARCWRVS